MLPGEICFSEEIMHGLGRGDVFVSVGLVRFVDEDMVNAREKKTYYGDQSLFSEESGVAFKTAVEVNNNKGSFRVAVQLLSEQKSIVASVSWTAVKVMSVEEKFKGFNDNQSIAPETPTVRMAAKDSFFFNVRFINMEPARLTYELTEVGSGEITPDGVYTAPSEEGVYEIHIFCTDIPEITTYAYAIVSKGLKEGEKGNDGSESPADIAGDIVG